MNKDLLKEVVKEVVESLVDEKTIKDIAEEKVGCLLNEYFEDAIESKARQFANLASKEKIDEMIEKMFFKEIVVDDGWNKTKTYKSFEELMKERIYENTNKSSIDYTIKKRVDEKIKEMCNKVAEENKEKFANEVLMKLGGKNE